MLKGIRSIAMVSALVTIAGSSGRANAEEPNDASERAGADEGKKSHAQNGGDETKKRRDAKGSNERRGSSDRKTTDRKSVPPPPVPARMNEAFTFSLGGGCDYTSTVRGTVKPARTAGGEEPKYVPALTVNAWISCQNNTELRVTDNSLREIAMTRAELEQAIELRASLLAEGTSSRCAYVPDFALGENKLSAAGIFYLCPTNGSGGGALLDVEMQEEATRPAMPSLDRLPANMRAVPETRPANDTRDPRARDRAPSDEPR